MALIKPIIMGKITQDQTPGSKRVCRNVASHNFLAPTRVLTHSMKQAKRAQRRGASCPAKTKQCSASLGEAPLSRKLKTFPGFSVAASSKSVWADLTDDYDCNDFAVKFYALAVDASSVVESRDRGEGFPGRFGGPNRHAVPLLEASRVLQGVNDGDHTHVLSGLSENDEILKSEATQKC